MTNISPRDLLRKIPALTKILNTESAKNLCAEFGTGICTLLLREIIEQIRANIQQGKLKTVPDLGFILAELEKVLLRYASPVGRRVINATGVMLHTGLGRSPLSAAATAALSTMTHYSILEVDIESGERSQRENRLAKLLQVLTGSEAATVVNNNAAATFLVLNTIAKGKEVIISRGQLIEIGGSFRMPDVMMQSGVKLREVGTTNRTHLADYENAINAETAALLHVHTSNYRIHGFTGTPGVDELVQLGKQYQLPVIDDLGSGALTKLSLYGLSDEALVFHSLQAGADVVCFSGDKLLCGPQAGIICGTNEAISRMRKNPFFRMFRVDKLTLAALEATLIHFINGEEQIKDLPLYQMLARPLVELERMAQEFIEAFAKNSRVKAVLADGTSYLGGGALPDEAIPTKVVCLSLKGKKSGTDLENLAKGLRLGIPSIFCRIQDDMLVFDMRTLLSGDLELLIDGVNNVV